MEFFTLYFELVIARNIEKLLISIYLFDIYLKLYIYQLVKVFKNKFL